MRKLAPRWSENWSSVVPMSAHRGPQLQTAVWALKLHAARKTATRPGPCEESNESCDGSSTRMPCRGRSRLGLRRRFAGDDRPGPAHPATEDLVQPRGV